MTAEKDRIIVTKEVEVDRYVTVDVDVTDQVKSRVEDGIKRAVRTPFNIDDAIVGTIRLSRTGDANPRTLLNMLLKQIGSDALTREVTRALHH
jgi:hypothetical protein